MCLPDLPADLGLAYPEQYIKKANGAAVGVEPVAEAVIRVSLIPYKATASWSRQYMLYDFVPIKVITTNSVRRHACKSSVTFAPFATT